MSPKTFELRATMSLVRLLNMQAHRDDARTMLVHICPWLTRGLTRQIWKDAKVFIDQLAALTPCLLRVDSFIAHNLLYVLN
jgi:TorA maturation chaperone TorD